MELRGRRMTGHQCGAIAPNIFIERGSLSCRLPSGHDGHHLAKRGIRFVLPKTGEKGQCMTCGMMKARCICQTEGGA